MRLRNPSLPRPTVALPSGAVVTELVGVAVLVTGIGLIYLPAALIVAGALFIYLAQGMSVNDTAGQ